MIRAATPDQVRAAERPLLEAGVPLMQRAAAALAARLVPLLRERAGHLSGARLVILAGPGSNGGDALLAGAHLARRGVAVTAVGTSERIHEDGAAALRRNGGRLERACDGQNALARADVLVDGVLGIGGRTRLDAPLRELLAAAMAAPAPIVAVDVPTGVDAATGVPGEGAVRADLTVTFGAAKSGLLLPGAAEHVGVLEVVDVGLAPHLPAPADVRRLTADDVRALWPVPSAQDHKYSRGVVTIDAGSEDFPGAAVLSTEGAARTGAGMVRYRGPAAVRDLILQRRPEVVGTDGRRQALVIGSGLPPEDPRCRAGVLELRAPDAVGVIDAGALGAIQAGDRFGPRVVLTPHAGEAARLAEVLDLDPRQEPRPLAVALSRSTGATVLLKGSVTLVAPGDDPEHIFSQADATPWLATAGAGDVLGGIVGTLLAAGIEGGTAAALGALVHGRAAVSASRGGIAPLVALDVADAVPVALAAILGDAAEPTARRGGA